MTITVAYFKDYERSAPSLAECQSRKHYSFNVDDTEDVQSGDVLDSPEYDNKMVVVKVLPVEYDYYSMQTGELSNEYTSTMQRPIKKLKLQDEPENTVQARKL